MFHFKPEKVNLDEKIGTGTFGTVYPYQKDPSDKKWVVKNVNTKDVDEVLAYFQEIVIGFSCNHPYVLPMKGYYIDYNKIKRDWDIYIKLPRIDRSLRTILNEHKQDKKMLSENMIAQHFYELIQGLQYLHDRGIAHRDIKPDNVLINDDDKVKIADFGLGTFQGGESTRNALAERAGSGFYAAPENFDPDVKLKKEDLYKADLWSLGMVLFELCTRMELRYLDFSNRKNMEDHLAKKLQEFEGSYSKELISLILSLLKIKPSDRKDLKNIQQELSARYGAFLAIEKRTKGVQTEMGALDLVAKTILKKLEEKEQLITKMEKEQKDAIANYELILKDLEKRLEAKDLEVKIKLEDQIAHLEEAKVQQLPQQNKKTIKTITQEFRGEWGGDFKIINESEGGISIKRDSPEITNFDENIMKDLIKRLDSDVCEPLQHLKLSLSGMPHSQLELIKVFTKSIQCFQDLQTLYLEFSVPILKTVIFPREIETVFKQLVTAIGSNLKQLKSLKLIYPSQWSIDSEIREWAADTLLLIPNVVIKKQKRANDLE